MAKKKDDPETKKQPRNAYCSFCRKNYREVGPLVEGPGDVYICGECIELCQSIIEQEKRRRGRGTGVGATPPLPSVEEVQRRLGAFLPGQDEASRSLAASVCRHFEGLTRTPQEGATGGGRAFLVVGPTQSSKLLVARALAHIFEVPFAGGDITTLTTDGPAGRDTDTLLYKLLLASDFDIAAAQTGIIYVGGIDRPDCYPSLARALDRTADYGLPRELQAHGLQMDVRQILFICGGRFEGIEKVIGARGRHPEQPMLATDLVAWGMPADLVQRFQLLVALNPLSDDILVRLLSAAPLEDIEGAAS
jgi:ATP-dependent Clp protease ATP-binding subunit ClpX